jgi:ribosomal protein S18 acetylase RimI-like enzyme
MVDLVRFDLSDRKTLERFIRVPWYIHREHHPSEAWIPPLLMDRRDYLNPKKNPFFDHADCAFWIAVQGGKDVGRIAAVVDHDWEPTHGDKCGHFGLFESPDDPAVAKALMDAALAWLKERGRTNVLGPMDLSTNAMCGALVEGFDTGPGMQMPYNPPYYDALLKGLGLSKAKDLWQWWLSTSTPIPEKVVRIAGKVAQRNKVVVRPMDLKDWDNEVSRIIEIYNDAWEQNWGFVPVGEKEFRHIAADLKLVVTPSLALMAEVDGEPVAFSIAILNLNPLIKKIDGKLWPTGLLRLLWDFKVKRDVRDCRLIVLGIKGGYRRRGIDSILFVETHRAAGALGLDGGEIGWTLEDNDMVNRAIEAMNGTKIKTYRIYGREL